MPRRRRAPGRRGGTPAASARERCLRAAASRQSGANRSPSPVACFTVSRTGNAAIAAPCSAPAAMVRSISAAVTNGRAASWTTTMSLSVETRARALPTESCRRRPPATKSTGLTPGTEAATGPARDDRQAPRRRSRRSRCWRAADTLRSRMERPPISRNCLGRSEPSRVPRPPAAMMAETRMSCDGSYRGDGMAPGRVRRISSVTECVLLSRAAAIRQSRPPPWPISCTAPGTCSREYPQGSST